MKLDFYKTENVNPKTGSECLIKLQTNGAAGLVYFDYALGCYDTKRETWSISENPTLIGWIGAESMDYKVLEWAYLTDED